MDKKQKKYCMGCDSLNERSKWSKLKDWCCKYSTVAQRARSICLQQTASNNGIDGRPEVDKPK